MIQLYYDRREFPYTVEYVDYEQEKLYDDGLDSWDGTLWSRTYSGDDCEPVGTTVEISPDTMFLCTVEGEEHYYTRVSDRQLSLTIRPEMDESGRVLDEPETNVIKVYYRKDTQRLLRYELVCLDETEEEFASLSRRREVVENAESIMGCEVYINPLLEDYFIFRGWYSTPELSRDLLSTELEYIPSLPGADMTYYAIFEIRKVHANVEIMYNDDGDYNNAELSLMRYTMCDVLAGSVEDLRDYNDTPGGDDWGDWGDDYFLPPEEDFGI